MGLSDFTQTVHVGGKRNRPAPKETREQIIARNSFPGPDQNRHIDKFLAEIKSVRASA